MPDHRLSTPSVRWPLNCTCQRLPKRLIPTCQSEYVHHRIDLRIDDMAPRHVKNAERPRSINPSAPLAASKMVKRLVSVANAADSRAWAYWYVGSLPIRVRQFTHLLALVATWPSY